MKKLIVSLAAMSFLFASCNLRSQAFEEEPQDSIDTCASEESDCEYEGTTNQIDNFVGMYQLDWGYAPGHDGQQSGIEILNDGRCLKWWLSDKIRKEYIGEIQILDNSTFQIRLTDYNNIKSINLAYFSSDSEDEREGRASWWPNHNNSYPHKMLFERVGYGICGYETPDAYRNKDVSQYHYAKFYKVN